MILKNEDAGLFYNLFLPLLDYVNETYQVTVEHVHFEGESIDPQDALEAARFLWERTWIIDDYLTAVQLPEEQREILESWKRCVPGTFIVERHLKKGSVFISVDDNSVYLVHGIISSWEVMLQGAPLPVVLQATLLPFKNVIISDGLVSVKPVRFGRSIASDFKDVYMNAKRGGTLITNI